jgi:hypothetical protein
MNTPIKLEVAKLPKALADLVHSNQFLKIFSICSSGITTIALALAFASFMRPPVVLAFAPSAQVLSQVDLPKAEEEIRSAVARYLDLRYKWDPTNVREHLKAAEIFVGPSALTAFQAAAANVTKFSQDKNVSQKIFPDQVGISVEAKRAIISGDRLTTIQGIKAAGELKLELTFEFGSRTKQNPWGVYITKEKEQ